MATYPAQGTVPWDGVLKTYVDETASDMALAAAAGVTPASIGAQPAGSYASAAQGTLADSSVQPGDLASVATSGAYGDLSGTPAIPSTAAQVGALPDTTTASDIGGVVGVGVTDIVALTQTAYDGLGTKDATTLYLIVGA